MNARVRVWVWYSSLHPLIWHALHTLCGHILTEFAKVHDCSIVYTLKLLNIACLASSSPSVIAYTLFSFAQCLFGLLLRLEQKSNLAWKTEFIKKRNVTAHTRNNYPLKWRNSNGLHGIEEPDVRTRNVNSKQQQKHVEFEKSCKCRSMLEVLRVLKLLKSNFLFSPQNGMQINGEKIVCKLQKLSYHIWKFAALFDSEIHHRERECHWALTISSPWTYTHIINACKQHYVSFWYES